MRNGGHVTGDEIGKPVGGGHMPKPLCPRAELLTFGYEPEAANSTRLRSQDYAWASALASAWKLPSSVAPSAR